ncbi:L-asparagine oxygenase [Micromonospora rhizosphaerae]|uniref:L-asparagine oxygenase n=1 Tax=Micromonospora rhizosphaerae TaxID=568872 RepID=A0A1C6RDN2_9ACTN|nr:TauD/TfdA family dioxygenase [Micromonospora rhizosphaerae]SCL15259.1 L-asparagine oxygenase [Micromonospora rhizosphaerae]
MSVDQAATVTDDEGRAWPIREAGASALVLSEEDSECLRAVALGVAARHASRPSGLHLDDSDLMVDCKLRMLRDGPESLVQALTEFRYRSNPDGALLLRNLPIDDALPPTPEQGNFDGDWQRLKVASMTQLAVMNILGDVISYADEKAGRIIQDVVPVAGAEKRQENTGSCFLELHTEDGFHPQRPRFISLLALRPDHERVALTLASGIRRSLACLDGGTREVLARPIYRIRLSSSFVGDREDVYAGPVPVLTGSLSDPDLCVDFHAMTSDDPEGRRAIDSLRRAILTNLVGHVLAAGDLLIVDNDKAVHGRTGFTARYDGQDRWLRRSFAVPDLRRSTADRMPRSHVHRRIFTPGTDHAVHRRPMFSYE